MNLTTRIGGALSAALAATCLSANTASAFYMPGVKAESFKAGSVVEMKVNALTSIHTQIPKPYYRFPFCVPEEGISMASENLGEFLTGNKIQNSPYIIKMKEEMYCEKVCEVELDTKKSLMLKRHIKFGYNNNWIIDNLPSASVGMTQGGHEQKHYAGGFPIGFVDEESKEPYIFNHVNIMLDFHEPEGVTGEYRIVGFSVEPISIKHIQSGEKIKTCTDGQHMQRKNVQKNQSVTDKDKIVYTYDVTWRKSDNAWASRWDVYLTEDNLVPAQVHWYSITNSILVVLFLSLLVIGILVRNLKRDIAGYNSVSILDEEEDDEEGTDETGWKLIHADVFRPPSTMPMLYCVLVGSGTQLVISTMISIVLAAVGYINPSRRGSMINAMLILYVLCGSLAGYISSRLYKAFRGRAWQLCTVITATFFPGLCFFLFLFFNTVLAFFRSSGAVPFLDIIIIAAMWCCISIPMVFVGAYFGYKREAMKFPTVTSTIARAIPPQSGLLNPKLGICVAGIIPFGAAYVELFFIMSSLWMDQYYYVFGFTLMVYAILLITTAEITTLLVYYQLVIENHRWWWFSFAASGSVAGYMFVYSIIWFKSLEPSKLVFTYILYFGYMFLSCFTVFLVTGAVGALTSLWFVKKIFGSIKVD